MDKLSFYILVGLLLSSPFGCADSDGDSGGDGVAVAISDGPNPCLDKMKKGGVVGSGKNTLTGFVQDTPKGDPIGGIEVVLLDNDTGQKKDVTTVTKDDGSFTLEGLDDGWVGLLVVATESDKAGEQRIDSLHFNIPSDAEDIVIYSVTKAIHNFIVETTEIDPNILYITGNVLFFDQECNEFPVDCATVEPEPKGDVFYVSCPPTEKEDGTKKLGIFMLANLEATPGVKQKITVAVGGIPIGSASIPLIAPKDATFGENRHFIKVYAEGIGDPSPGCEADCGRRGRLIRSDNQ